jgi:hypothetical protein
LKIYAYVAILVGTLVSGCTIPMTQVIEVCNKPNAPFPVVSKCVQDTYSEKGNAPRANSVQAFYAELAVINEDYKNKNISDAQAKANLYRAYQNTVGADNARSRVCMPMNGMIICQ